MRKFHVLAYSGLETVDDEFNLPFVRFSLVDENNKPVSQEQLYEAYRDLTAIGYNVQLKAIHLDKPYPSAGVVNDITDTYVLVDDTQIPRGWFHMLYEVD